MRRLFQKLKRECKGAVTVFVTLLLIPAVLVSGTGVDLARVYTARSILQDANQLAANSALASYDALLQDLYGLFGVMKDDPEFASLVDEYIRVAVFGDGQATGMGTFQLFYGSELEPGDIVPAEGQHLENPEVLRRQIEEYAKFRAPVIIVNEILDRLDAFENVQKDGEIIRDKMEIDEKIEEIDELYREIYLCIQTVNGARTFENEILDYVNEQLSAIKEQIRRMRDTRDDYVMAAQAGDWERAQDCETEYTGYRDNIITLITGSSGDRKLVSGWIPGGIDENGEYQSGYWSSEQSAEGMEQALKGAKELLNRYIDEGISGENSSLRELVLLCQKADEKKDELSEMVDELERKVESGACSDSLRDGLTQPQPEQNGMSVIEHYRSLLGYELTPMAEAMYSKDAAQITGFCDLMDGLVYEDERSSNRYSIFGYLSDFGNQVPITLPLEPNYSVDSDLLLQMVGITPKPYDLPWETVDEYQLFQSSDFGSTHNPEFYQILEESYSQENDGEKDKVKDSLLDGLGKMLDQIKGQFSKFLEFDPLGAYYYDNGADDSADTMTTDFGTTGDWSDTDEVQDLTKEALNSDLLSRVSSAAGGMADKMILLIYDTEMFSCYSTSGGEDDDLPLEENMNGIPLSTDVNYYFQSELEYLYNGNLRDARANLVAVTCMIFLVRFVLNYTASFMVDDVRNTVSLVKTALAWTGPFAIIAGELARLVMALGESVIDVSRLKDGAKVALFKSEDNWRFSISGQLTAVGSGSVGTLSESQLDGGSDKQDDKQAPGVILMGYKDYLRLLLLLKDGNTLAQRTANLIELNVTNKRNNIGDLSSREEREAAMRAAEKFDMRNAVTGFSVTSTVQLRMLFLSMPFAQRGVDGVVPPGMLSLSATDYRGY